MSTNYYPDIWDRRRKAPFHFFAKAVNARLSAFILSSVDEATKSVMAEACGYTGSHNIAVNESFRREASIALELIVKANLCVTTKRQPKLSHDVYDLWIEARLPDLGDDDWFRLAVVSETLYWSGRYAAPTNNKQLQKDQDRFERHQKFKTLGSLRLLEPVLFDWASFESLFQLAAAHFWSLEPNDPRNYVP